MLEKVCPAAPAGGSVCARARVAEAQGLPWARLSTQGVGWAVLPFSSAKLSGPPTQELTRGTTGSQETTWFGFTELTQASDKS